MCAAQLGEDGVRRGEPPVNGRRGLGPARREVCCPLGLALGRLGQGCRGRRLLLVGARAREVSHGGTHATKKPDLALLLLKLSPLLLLVVARDALQLLGLPGTHAHTHTYV